MRNEKWKMICSTSMPTPLTLDTPIDELHKFRIARLGQTTSHKLASALAGYHNKKNAGDTIVEDLLTYLPMRYEDRSNLAGIRDLKHDVEASLELYVKNAAGY